MSSKTRRLSRADMGREPRTRGVRGLAAALLVIGTLGCAQRTDWIEGTLVTVDVSGLWRGTLIGGAIIGEMEMILTQQGPRVTGDGRVRAEKISIEGTVRGDVFSFSEPNGRLHAEATVAGDEMSGRGRTNIIVPQNFREFSFKLSR